MAITLVVFTFLRLLVSEDLRAHYLTAVTRISSFLHPPVLPKGSYWLVSSGLVGPGGQLPGGPIHGGPNISFGGVQMPVASLPSACQTLLFRSPPNFRSCLAAHGIRAFISYQPADRYWAFQGIETGIFVLLAAALLAVTAIVVLRRDA